MPLANLTATLSVSGTGGVVSLSWTAGDSNTDGYTIKAKTSNTGTYSDVTTELSGTTYTDTLSSGKVVSCIRGIMHLGRALVLMS